MKSFVFASALALSSAAFAAPLLPGTSLFTAPVEAAPIGTVVASLASPFATGLYSGTLYSFVLSGDVSNPHGGLTFVYYMANDVTSINSLNRLTLNGFAGWLTDASTDPAGGPIPAIPVLPPPVRPVATDRDLTSNVVGFSFLSILPGFTRIAPGQISRGLVIQTDAPFFTTNIGNVIDGAVTTAPILVPAIPAPGAAGLVILGGLAIARRRRR